MFKLGTNLSDLAREYEKSIKSVERGTQWAAQKAAEESRQRMEAYLMAFVYNTVPGDLYVRTEDALRKLGMTLLPTGSGDYLLTLRNDSNHAMQIELGNELDYHTQMLAGGGQAQIPAISDTELAMLLDSVADETGTAQPQLFFNRTGQQYQQPGPHVTPAAVDAIYRFQQLLHQVWHNAGAT